MKPFTPTEILCIKTALNGKNKKCRHIDVAKKVGCLTSQELYDRLYVTGYKIYSQMLEPLGHAPQILTYNVILTSKTPVHFNQRRFDETLEAAISQL